MNESNDTSPVSGHESSDLSWLAFQYIAGELTAAEVERFEERLAIDQDAREAVARAVELAEATATALEATPELAPAILETSGWRSLPTVVWAIAGIAAAIAIVITMGGVLRTTNNDDQRNQFAQGHGEVRELAMAWATGRTELMNEATETAEESLTESGAEEVEVEGIETPSWMLVAVASLSQSTAENGDQNEQGLE